MIRSNTFEVTVEISGRPEIEGIYQDETIALERAHDLLKRAKYTAVRVYRVSASDSHTLIFEQFYTGAGVGSTIATIDDAYLCNSVNDVYTFGSRLTILRLLRSYFDQQLTIPLELLHDTMALRALERDALLFSQAGHRLSTLQGQQLKARPDERYDVLTRLFRDVFDFSKTSDRLVPYADHLKVRGLTAMIAEVGADFPLEEHDRVITFGVARTLREARDWSLKLDAACDLFEDGQSDTAAMRLDEVLAEIIDGNAAIKAVLGYAPDLAMALRALLAVVDGSWDDRLPGTRSLHKLKDIVAHQSAPRVRAALLNRVATALGGRTPLTKADRATNGEALKHLVPKIVDFGGFMGGTAMTAALTRRAKVDFSTGHDDLSFERTVGILCEFLPTPAGKIGYLLDLLPSEMGRRKTNYLTRLIAELFSQLRSVHEFAPNVDASWSYAMVREDFRRRLYQAGIPRVLADGLMQKLDVIQGGASLPVTGSQPVPAPNQDADIGELVLTYRGTHCVVVPSKTPFTIGRSPNCHLAIDWGMASRAHAVVRVEGHEFVLHDQSKNGTFVRGSDQKTVSLTKTAIVLTGQGTITIGLSGDDPDATESAVITFQRVTPP